MRSVFQKKATYWVQRLRLLCNAIMPAVIVASASLLINSALVCPSIAQLAALPMPEYTLKDENNVDLLSFNFYLDQTDLSIGDSEHPLTHTIHSGPDGGFAPGDNFGASGAFDSLIFAQNAYPAACPAASGSTPYVTVRFAGSSETFAAVMPGCGSYRATDPTSSTLSLNTNNYTYTYTKRDGTQIIFYCGNTGGEAECSQLQQIIYPDGRILTYGYSSSTSPPQSVTRSDGLQFKYNWTVSSSGLWTLNSVTAINNAYEYCSPTATVCSLTRPWLTTNYAISTPGSGGSVFTVTDSAGRVTQYTAYPNYTYGIKLPSSTGADNITYTLCGTSSNWCSSFAAEYPGLNGYPYQLYVASVIRDGQTWTYSGTPGSYGYYQCGTATYGFTNPVSSGKQVAVTNCMPNMYPAAAPLPGFNPLLQLTDEQGVQFVAGYWGGLISTATKPEGNQTQYVWHDAAAVSKETFIPKANSGLATPPPLTANYPTSGNCTPVTCNQPVSIIDSLINETDYTYDPTHGGMLTKTSPADSNGIRAQTRRTYTQRYAWVLNSSGTYVKSAAPIWVLATESYCRTSAAVVPAGPPGSGCTTAGDEVVTTYEYGPDSGPNNLFLRGVSITADGATHRTCYGRDIYGNKISQTEADAGLASCP